MCVPDPASLADLAPPARDEADLDTLIREDQVTAVRHSLSISIPVNVILSLATFGVATQHGQGFLGGLWLAVASAVNLLRFGQSRLHARQAAGGEPRFAAELFWASYLSGLSGLVWACTPLLASQSAAPDAAFHLIVGAGITGGAIAMGFAYAPVAICFVMPILVSNTIALLASSTTEHRFLAGTVVIYLAALYRSAYQSQQSFRASTKLKHEATTLARSLHEAHAQATVYADEMAHRASHDSLTGLLNRVGFLQTLGRQAGETDATRCVMMLDLDGFKSINDTFGHKVGDRVLIEVASRISSAVPVRTALARLGGDEFALVFEREAVGDTPGAIAERLIAAIGAPFPSFDAGRLGVSIGIHLGDPSETTEALVYADEALYAAKSAGRNRHCFFDAKLRRRLEMRRDGERDLLPALTSGGLEVWYQPIFSDGGRRLASAEALLRWNHPRHGWIPPVEIIAVAALSGHSEHLLRFVIDQACAMARRLGSHGRADMAIAVNVSPREMSQLPVDAIVLDRLRAAGLPASSLEIEITEEMAIDIKAVAGKLAALSDAGIRIAIDDFGVGYSSFSALRRLHADRIKIDRCFVTGLAATSDDNRTLVQAVVTLGRAMKLDVVAEGVESAEEVVILRALGCQFMQGYHLGVPMPAEEMLNLVACQVPGAKTTAA